MSEPTVRLTQAQTKPGEAVAQPGHAPDDTAWVQHSPERLDHLFRHIRGQPEGTYLLELVRRYRRPTLP